MRGMEGLAAFDAGRMNPRGLGRIEKPHEALVDALPRAGGLVASKRRVKGLRLSELGGDGLGVLRQRLGQGAPVTSAADGHPDLLRPGAH